MHFFSGNREEGDDEDIIVEADKGRIIQVISNILSNAIRFAKEGDVSKGEVIVSIKDTGIGIHPDVFPRLFSKFAVTSETVGTGLGLFISKNIIEAHGGRIWAENNATDKGATFSFSLPLNN